MNPFSTIFFPDTDVLNEKYYPLLLFFTPLHFLQVVEPGPGPVINSEPILLLKSGMCQPHVPAPLGDNREQFKRLISDIGKRKEHFNDQSSGLITASSLPPPVGESLDPKYKIVASLLQKYGVDLETSGADMQLWQARLVLALAEILDNDEEALKEQLFFFNEDEITMFRSLQDAEDSNEEDVFGELENIKVQLAKSRLGNIAKRFDAWLRLLKCQPFPPVKVWLASTRDSADQIFNRYKSTGNARTVPLLKLALPAHITASGKYMVEQIAEFQQATAHIHRGLVADFEQIVSTVPYLESYESLLPYGTDWAAQWEGVLEDFYPFSSDGRNNVNFYLLPNQPTSRLLSLHESPGISLAEPAHGLIAVLGSPQP